MGSEMCIRDSSSSVPFLSDCFSIYQLNLCMDAAAEVRQSLLAVEVPIYVREEHTIIIEEALAQASLKAGRGLWLPPAVRHPQAALLLRIVNLCHEADASVKGTDSDPLAI